MAKRHLIKAGAVVLLVAALLLSPQPQRDWAAYALLLFGLGNVLLEVPGTMAIRVSSAVYAFAVLIWQNQQAVVWATLTAWLLWPPAFMVAWSLARPLSESSGRAAPDGNAKGQRARLTVAAIIAAVAIAAVAYRVVLRGGLQQTAALFIGIPTLLAIVVVLAVSPRSAVGVALKAVTVGLLVSLIFLQEGMLCVLISAPLFYLVAIVIAIAFNRLQRYKNKQSQLLSGLVLLSLLPLGFEGVLPATTADRNQTVSETRVLGVPADRIKDALFATPRFDRAMPLPLRAGFPRPMLAAIEKDAGGTRWRIRFRGGEMRLNGIEPRTGDLILLLEKARPGYLRWRAVSDSSHMTHFLRWREIVAEWTPGGGGDCRVTWTIRYERGLDPAWYFGPLERYAVRLAASYLIDTVATP
jgi:hypothetical protein